MRFTTLISWLLTASLGAFMLRGQSLTPAGCHGLLRAPESCPRDSEENHRKVTDS
jgi:hypothetical protein